MGEKELLKIDALRRELGLESPPDPGEEKVEKELMCV